MDPVSGSVGVCREALKHTHHCVAVGVGDMYLTGAQIA